MHSDDPAELRAFAAKCRQLAPGASAEDVAATLLQLAEEYERLALAAEEAAAAGTAPEPPADAEAPPPAMPNPQQGG